MVSLSALIACNAMNWPGGAAISCSPKFHHWLMMYTLGQYIMNVQWSKTSDRFLTIIIFGIRKVIFPHMWYARDYLWCMSLLEWLKFWSKSHRIPGSLWQNSPPPPPLVPSKWKLSEMMGLCVWVGRAPPPPPPPENENIVDLGSLSKVGLELAKYPLPPLPPPPPTPTPPTPN